VPRQSASFDRGAAGRRAVGGRSPDTISEDIRLLGRQGCTGPRQKGGAGKNLLRQRPQVAASPIEMLLASLGACSLLILAWSVASRAVISLGLSASDRSSGMVDGTAAADCLAIFSPACASCYGALSNHAVYQRSRSIWLLAASLSSVNFSATGDPAPLKALALSSS
jgi:hypothetical protein